jgi:hypothetical protein
VLIAFARYSAGDMGKSAYADVMVKAMRELTATELPVVLPLRVVEHLIALAEISHPGLFAADEAVSLAAAKAAAEEVRTLAGSGNAR